MKVVYPLYGKKAITNLVLHALFFLSFTVQGVWAIVNENIYSVIFSVAIVVTVLLSAYLTIYSNGPFTPRIEVNNKYLVYRPQAFSLTQRISWSDIVSIRVSKYALTVLKNDSETEYLHFENHRGTQKPVLNLIKHLSQRKDIEVTY